MVAGIAGRPFICFKRSAAALQSQRPTAWLCLYFEEKAGFERRSTNKTLCARASFLYRGYQRWPNGREDRIRRMETHGEDRDIEFQQQRLVPCARDRREPDNLSFCQYSTLLRGSRGNQAAD